MLCPWANGLFAHRTELTGQRLMDWGIKHATAMPVHF